MLIIREYPGAGRKPRSRSFVIGEDGELLDAERSTRSIPAAKSRVLWLRDGRI
jgi:hypothetical protein